MSLKKLIEYLDAELDLQIDLDDLKELGLTEEELEGYKEFFFDNYFIESK